MMVSTSRGVVSMTERTGIGCVVCGAVPAKSTTFMHTSGRFVLTMCDLHAGEMTPTIAMFWKPRKV
jgi:hypothetical protein